MTNREATDIAETAVILARLSPKDVSAYRVATAVVYLRRLEREAHSWAELLCNCGEPSEGSDERKRASVRKRAFTVLQGIIPLTGIEITIEGDPRGSCLKVKIPTYPAEIRF